MYAADGQNWGCPVYNWEAMKENKYSWWRNRLLTMSQYYHIYRIDHVVGFFRIWAIQKYGKAVDGAFDPPDTKLWIPQGEELMKMLLETSEMLPIGEDLGTVPTDVRICLQRLGICGTKVLRWERKWDEKDQPFIPINDFNADSMSTVSTHDSETLSQWWETQKSDFKMYCKHKGWKCEFGKPLTTDHRIEMLRDSIHHRVYFTSICCRNIWHLFLNLRIKIWTWKESTFQQRYCLPIGVTEWFLHSKK